MNIFLRNFVYFCILLHQKVGLPAKRSGASATACTKACSPWSMLQKITVFHRIIKKNQNKNFVKKINHEYFGGSDVMNVSMDMCSPVKAVKSFVYEKNPAFHYSLEPRGSKKGRKS